MFARVQANRPQGRPIDSRAHRARGKWLEWAFGVQLDMQVRYITPAHWAVIGPRAFSRGVNGSTAGDAVGKLLCVTTMGYKMSLLTNQMYGSLHVCRHFNGKLIPNN